MMQVSTGVRVCCLLSLLACLAQSVSAAPEPVESKVTHVTLYRGQAMVTRTLTVEGKEGGFEVVVGNLPQEIVTGSMFAEGGEQVEVRAVQYRNRAVGEEPREEVRKLDQQIEQTNQKIEINKRNQQIMLKRSEYVDKLEGFVVGTGKSDLSKGVLDAVALEKITTFAFDQRQVITDEQIKLNQESRDLQKELELLARKRAELTNGASRTVREATLFLQKHDDEPQKVRLNYLVNSCGWSPSYTMRAGQDREKVKVEYNALIHQLTGEEWADVTLVLSTASPALSAAGPGLAPFRVALSADQQKQQQAGANAKELLAQVESIKGRQSMAIEQNRNTYNFIDNTATAWGINGAANELQALELHCAPSFVVTLNTGANENGEGPSLSYELAGRVSLPSRNDQQMVRILQSDLASSFYHVATPVLTSYVYREAELTNNSPEDLLAGPISVYLDGRFVGRSELPTVARGQAFVVGFGADPQLRTQRELAEKTENVQGGNREVQFTYRLVIENYKEDAAPLRLIDRIPVADRSADIRVSLGDTTDSLSDDKLYARQERPSGILRWDIDAPAGATGEDAKLVEYTYTVEYDRNFQLASPSGTQQLQQEFEQLQRGRLKR